MAEYLRQRSPSPKLELTSKSSRVYTIQGNCMTPSLSAYILRHVLCSEIELQASLRGKHRHYKNRCYIPDKNSRKPHIGGFHQDWPSWIYEWEGASSNID
ncbi:uncharacterized protein TrAFT101_003747 [Trichoderma asperellum]|uniref:uncharacterized protein n=1 Tax=Trichoderma asperellum TaxID=101201 RepID=UPI003330C61F|nr:hypothetical protein TrAFT101_003747 [Trichoderma asperellum]